MDSDSAVYACIRGETILHRNQHFRKPNQSAKRLKAMSSKAHSQTSARSMKVQRMASCQHQSLHMDDHISSWIHKNLSKLSNTCFVFSSRAILVEGQRLEVCETLEEAALRENKQITSPFLRPFWISLKKDGKLWKTVPCLPQTASLTEAK